MDPDNTSRSRLTTVKAVNRLDRKQQPILADVPGKWCGNGKRLAPVSTIGTWLLI